MSAGVAQGTITATTILKFNKLCRAHKIISGVKLKGLADDLLIYITSSNTGGTQITPTNVICISNSDFWKDEL
jgi:hypothetical protein